MTGNMRSASGRPAMDESKVIYFSALKSGEKMYSDPVVAATYGPNPAVFVI